MYLNDSAGQRRAEESGKIVGVRKTGEYRRQHDQRHARKEHVIETAAGQVRRASTRPGVFRSCGHGSPKLSGSPLSQKA